MKQFACIKQIQLDNEASWKNANFLTFDIDWASDEILAYTTDMVESAGVPATWFVTHPTPMIERWRRNPKFELGIHPNFNPLLQFGPPRETHAPRKIIDELLTLVPEAKSVRSHSLTQSTPLLDTFAAAGLTHECNHLIPHHAQIALAPWKHWNKMLRVPFFWEDDVACLYQENVAMNELSERQSLKVFNFHPIHIALNTSSLDLYNRTRPVHNDWDALTKQRNQGHGAETWLRELIN